MGHGEEGGHPLVDIELLAHIECVEAERDAREADLDELALYDRCEDDESFVRELEQWESAVAA